MRQHYPFLPNRRIHWHDIFAHHIWQFYIQDNTILNEICQIYSKKITDTLQYTNSVRNIKLYNNLYQYFNILMPGMNIDVTKTYANIIDNLQLFVYHDLNNTIQTPQIKVIFDYPFYLQYDNHINVLSIIIHIPNNYNDYNKLQSLISENLYTVLEKCKKEKICQLDNISNILRLLYILKESDLIRNDDIVSLLYTFYVIILNTQDNAIKSAVYTSLIEGKIANISKELFISSIDANYFNVFYNEFMVTYHNYMKIKKQIQFILENINIFKLLQPLCLDIIYQLYPNMAIDNILHYQSQLIDKYIHDLKEAIMKQYDDII